MGFLMGKLKQGSFLWLNGFKEACCLHRVFTLCYRSGGLLIRTSQCFVFNGFIFLGSVYILNTFVIPMLQWILPDRLPHVIHEDIWIFGAMSDLYLTLRKLLIQLFYVFWFYPLYVFSIILSSIWYIDIAQHGYIAMGKDKSHILNVTVEEIAPALQNCVVDKPAGLGGVMIGFGEQVYSLLLLSFFFLEVFATSFLPYIGKPLYFMLLSWMYAYYCFEYKWGLSGVPLDRRLDFFESNWAFFAGFGSPCVLAIFFLPPLESYAAMATLFPLFVLAATSSDGDNLIRSSRKNWLGSGLGRLPIFCAADTLSMKILSFLPMKLQKRS